MDLNYKANVTRWTSTKSTDNWLIKEFENQNAMLFLNPNDNEYNNVILTIEKGGTYKTGFAIGKGLQNYNGKSLKYQLNNFNKSELEK